MGCFPKTPKKILKSFFILVAICGLVLFLVGVVSMNKNSDPTENLYNEPHEGKLAILITGVVSMVLSVSIINSKKLS
jgi:uncharacterized membrane protein